MPLISYIIPSYNVPTPMLTACIDSVLSVNLSATEREIIVVDDGSTVPCSEVLDGYKDKVIILRQHNQGLSVARNTGIQHATGDYLHFVDADDMLLQQPYDKCLKLLRTLTPDILAFDFTTSANAPTAHNVTHRAYDSGAAFMQSCNLRVAACMYIFRRATLGTLRFVPNLKNEDERFTTLLYIDAGVVVVTNTQAYYYQQRTGSLQHTYDSEFVRLRLADHASTIRLCHGLVFSDRQKQLAMRRRVCQMTMDYLYNIIMLTRSRTRLNEAIDELTTDGLFPLPHVRYTVKYLIFSHLTSSTLGRALLLHILPILPKEK